MLSSSPRKVVPLASGDDRQPRSSSSTKRAFFAAVVVENAENNRPLPPDVHDLVISLGRTIDSPSSSSSGSTFESGGSNSLSLPEKERKPPPMTDTVALTERINELVRTEQTYVHRLRILKHDYADPLRKYSKSKETVIIPTYEATTLFGNIDNILPVNQAFLTDLERMVGPNGMRTVGGIGDVALKHFRTLKGFEHYRHYYAIRETSQTIFETELAKRDNRFQNYIDHIQYSSADTTNRIGLRELLMEPIQRIPRYTLLFREMIKYMAKDDPQREKLILADQLASVIAKAEPDEQIKRASIMRCLDASIAHFPADLICNWRKFIDCIDVEDVLGGGDAIASSSSSVNLAAAGNSLHCTLFLFDDKIVIVKRPGDKRGRVLAGLDEIEKSTKATAKKKPSMSFKGYLELTDIVATDVGGADFHLYLETPPQAANLTDRWANRPFRSLSVVNPPSTINLDPIKTESDKSRFLENLWTAQARYRSRAGQSVVLCKEEQEVESKGGRLTYARTFFNVYQRKAFLQEERKTKVVVHIDDLGSADDIPFGPPPCSPPLVIIRIQPMAGDLCRYKVSCIDPNDVGEQDIVQTERVPERIVHTIQQFGVFKFKTFNSSLPSTPTASTRSRAAIIGLDAISRSLFSSVSRPSRGEFGSISSSTHRKRSKSTASRSSVFTGGTITSTSVTTADDDSFARFSYKDNSTAVTTMSSMNTNAMSREKSRTDDDDDETFFATRSASKSDKSKSKKLLKRGRSPAGSDSEGGNSSSGGFLRRARSITRATSGSVASRSRSRTGSVSSRYSTADEDEEPEVQILTKTHIDQSELDLAMRLDLARRNSKNQHIVKSGISLDGPIEDTIYEEDPPQPLRPESRASSSHHTLTPRPESRASSSQCTITPRPESRTSMRPESRASTHFHSRSDSRGRPQSPTSPERRPLGPRSPSPLPHTGLRSPRAMPTDFPTLGSLDSMDLEKTLLEGSGSSGFNHSQDVHTPIPRSKRLPLFPTGNTTGPVTPTNVNGILSESTSAAKLTRMSSTSANLSSRNSVVEPLSIKKKTSVRSSTSVAATPPSSRKNYIRNSPLSKTTSRIVSPRRVSPQVKSISRNVTGSPKADDQSFNRLIQLARTTKADVDSSRRAIKRIKLEVERVGTNNSHGLDCSRPSSPDKFSRIPPKSTTHMTKEALERMEEMRQLLGKRSEDNVGSAILSTPTKRRPDIFSSRVAAFSPHTNGNVGSPSAVEDLVTETDELLCRSSQNMDVFASDLQQLASDLKAKLADLERNRIEVSNAKRQCDLVKSLLADATAEKEIMYEAFNEELDAMYNDANLPKEEAWVSMSKDLQKAKEARNLLSKENSNLKHRLAEAEMQRDQWGDLLRSHGLIP